MITATMAPSIQYVMDKWLMHIAFRIGALYPLYERLNCYPYPTLHSFSVAVKRRCPDWHIPSLFIYRYYWTYSRPEYIWDSSHLTLRNNHSITLMLFISYVVSCMGIAKKKKPSLNFKTVPVSLLMFYNSHCASHLIPDP